MHPKLRTITTGLEGDLKALKTIRARMAIPPEGEAMQWLHDNLYLVAGQAGAALSDLRALGGSRERLDHVGDMLAHYTDAFQGAERIDAHRIEAASVQVAEAFPVSYAELGLLPALVRASLINLCRRGAERSLDSAFVGRSIQGLIALGTVDMDALAERISPAHRRLLSDPAGVYADTEAESRRYLRELCYRIAHRTGGDELAVADEAIAWAQKAPPESTGCGVAGYLTAHPAVKDTARGVGKRLITWPLVAALALSALAGWAGRSLLVACFGFLPLYACCQQFIWPRLVGRVPTVRLLQMDQPDPAHRAVVAVVTLLPTADRAAASAAHLRRIYYKNRDVNARFIMLCDFAGADEPVTPDDEARAAALIREIAALNRDHGDHFGLAIRRREHNPREGGFAGRGRKMGAVGDLFAYVGGEPVDFYHVSFETAEARTFTHCLALDADTGPTLGSLRELMTAAAHPVNRPRVEPGANRVTDGYGILVPRLAPDLASVRATRFAKVMEGTGGVTAYDTAAADPYQDTFGESIFAGKGLIDIRAYRDVVSGSLPEDRMLSHDLIEGELLRVGLMRTVEFTDGTPPTAHSYLKRLSRWVRGDWQNAVFLERRFRWGGRTYHSAIGPLGRYKILDNLRRHLTPVAQLLCAVMAALLRGPQAALFAAVFWVSVLLPALRDLLSTAAHDGLFALSRRYFSGALTLFADMVGRLLFELCLLPTRAYMNLDATVRAVYRSAVSGRYTLQWQTAAQVESASSPGRAALAVGLPSFVTGALLLPFGGWGMAIGIAFMGGIPFAQLTGPRAPSGTGAPLPQSVRDDYTTYAAAIWQFFEDYVTAENHFLPPDNVQFFPVFREARRTSPTNIGFYLLSALTAADLGLIDAQGLHRRVERTIATVESLPKHAGNLYNWYDTESLELLQPPFVSSVDSGNFLCCLIALREGLMEYVGDHSPMLELAGRVDALIEATDLGIFYDRNRKLFVIGIDEKGEPTSSCYDFFMSECRLLSYWAVASGVAEKKHWGRLSRVMSRSGTYAGPLSWTGTLFEYFMPAILMPVFAGSLSDEALRFSLHCQMERGRAMRAPWGISESGFYAFDAALNYQYKAHGVQKNGVKQGLDRDFVVAPYATFLAAPFAPRSAHRNLARLRRDGVYGRYAFYEAADYRSPEGPDVVRSYMSHHMGMSLTAIGNLLRDGALQRRFMRDPLAGAGAELLQEKLSKKAVMIEGMAVDTPERRNRMSASEGEAHEPTPLLPRGHLLTNGMLSAVFSDSGGGYVAMGDNLLTRRSDDPLRPQGIFTLVKSEGAVLSATAAPLYDRRAAHSCTFERDAAVFSGETDALRLTCTDYLHPKYPAFVRKVDIVNRTEAARRVDLLCYAEPELSAHEAYMAHPTFSKMGIETAMRHGVGAACFTRRGPGGDMALAVGFDDPGATVNHLFDRQALLHSPNGVRDLAHFTDRPFDGRQSHDPCAAMRRTFSVGPGGTVSCYFILAQGPGENEALDTLAAVRGGRATLHAKRTASPFPIGSAEGRMADALIAAMRFSGPVGESAREAARRNVLSQDHLWGLSISGDLPMVLVPRTDAEQVACHLRIQKHFAPCGLRFDLIVLCWHDEEKTALERELSKRFPEGLGSHSYILNAEHLSEEVVDLLHAAACHIAGEVSTEQTPPGTGWPMPSEPVCRPVVAEGGLKVVGGSVENGAFRVERVSPLPYSHMLAGPVFGTLVTDGALGYSFYHNARENKLTPYLCDPTAHNDGERAMLRVGDRLFDLALGAVADFYEGGARYRGIADRLVTEVTLSVHPKAAAKSIEVTLENPTDEEVELMCAYYTEPVLGVDRRFGRMLRPAWEGSRLTVDNPYSVGFRTGMALGADRGGVYPVTDRRSFFAGDWAMSCRPDPDPCAAVVVPMKLPPHRREKVTFVLSAADSPEAARAVAQAAHMAEQRDRLSKLRIATPDPYLDRFVNDFAPAQIISGRIEGRSGYYQCGGAYGFRDQLQDAYGVLLTRPDLTKKQILKAAASQFEEGDVLHWWHQMPQRAGGKKGVRTRCSDDLLWLPYVTAAYLRTTGDEDILDTPVRYLWAEPLAEGRQDSYIQPGRSAHRGSLYEHCVRALDRAYRLGEHGLPLMGAGDWNDGFSEVGAGGRGESVWLALFTAMVCEDFAPIARRLGDGDYADLLLGRAGDLKAAVDAHAWDGDHYLRAFFDDGTPMGATESESCRIDLLPQSFAMLAGMPAVGRVDRAMQAAYDRLVDRENGIVRLFTPHFGRGSIPSPGYVASYPPGIRENGGQYTHGALWFVLALLRQGRTDEAYELLGWMNPLSRSANSAYAGRYLTEPYYMAADIYASPHTPGRGGWTLYTGAASWFYRIVAGEVIGLRREGDRLSVEPNVPSSWDAFTVEVEVGGSALRIEAKRTGRRSLAVDGAEALHISVDGMPHEVTLTF